MNKGRISYLLAISMMAVSGYSQAGASTGNLAVSATMVNACLVTSVDAMSFGSYDPTAAAAGAYGFADAGGAGVNFKCTPNATFTVSLGNGANYASSTRNMANGSNKLAYTIYSDSARTTPWATTATTTTVGSLGTNTVSFYGGVAAGQSVPAGSYSDTVVVSVNF